MGNLLSFCRLSYLLCSCWRPYRPAVLISSEMVARRAPEIRTHARQKRQIRRASISYYRAHACRAWRESMRKSQLRGNGAVFDALGMAKPKYHLLQPKEHERLDDWQAKWAAAGRRSSIMSAAVFYYGASGVQRRDRQPCCIKKPKRNSAPWRPARRRAGICSPRRMMRAAVRVLSLVRGAEAIGRPRAAIYRRRGNPLGNAKSSGRH